MNTAPAPQESHVEQRLATLEKQVASLLTSQPPKKDWQSTVGMFQDEPLFAEAMTLGREYREGQESPTALDTNPFPHSPSSTDKARVRESLT